MNSKILFAIILAVNICIINVDAQMNRYWVDVKTAYQQFNSHEGKLAISFISNNNDKIIQEDFVLTPNATEIKMDNIYTGTVSSIAPLKNITSVYLRWTLASPYNPYYAIKKPKIYFDYVTVTEYTLLPPLHLMGPPNRRFYPETRPIGIKHADGAIFNRFD